MHRRWIVVAVVFFAARAACGGTLYLNLDSQGTTANQNVFGTSISGTTVTWPGRNNPPYRDYQFRVSVPSGSATLDAFGIQLSANLRQQTDPTNTLRASLWTGPIPLIPDGTTTTPLFSSSVLTVTTPNTSFNTSSYETAVLGADAMPAQTITTTPSVFFVRVWAEGSQSNFGFQTKMADSVGDILMNSDFNATVEVLDITTDTYAAPAGQFVPLPEPDGAVLATIGAAGMAFLLARRRDTRSGVADRGGLHNLQRDTAPFCNRLGWRLSPWEAGHERWCELHPGVARFAPQLKPRGLPACGFGIGHMRFPDHFSKPFAEWPSRFFAPTARFWLHVALWTALLSGYGARRAT